MSEWLNKTADGLQTRKEIRRLKRSIRNERIVLLLRLRQWTDTNCSSFWNQSGADKEKALVAARLHAQATGFGIGEIMLIIQILTLIYRLWEMTQRKDDVTPQQVYSEFWQDGEEDDE